MDAAGPLSSGMSLAAHSLAVDRVTGEVAAALRRAGVRPVLLKGPAFARWLYEPGEVRGYSDSDLLVAPDSEVAARRVLADLGFEEDRPEETDSTDRVWHALTYRRRTDAAAIDLHRALPHVGAPPAELWRAFTEDTETVRVGGADVETPAEPARVLHVALHASQHGVAERPREDLRRALTRADADSWRAALALAERLDCVDGFGAGLRQLPEGARLAERLEVPPNRSVSVDMFAGSAPPVTYGLQTLAEIPGARARLRFLRRELVPAPEFMRVWSPLARRGRLGLAVAYAWRPAWLMLRLPAALVAWRRARRAVGVSGSGPSRDRGT